MTDLPTYIVEVGFTAATTGSYLHLDDVSRGLLDTGTLAPDDLWSDVSSFVTAFSISRGANRVTTPILRYDAGTATIRLLNLDRRFDPANLAGPYVAGGVTQVTPMRAVRIRATWNGVTYDLFRGTADSWAVSYSGPTYSEVVLTCTDGFKVLNVYDRAAVAAVGAGEDSGARVSRILDSVLWPATDRIVATGDSTLQATTLDGSALTELQLVADSEIGDLYIDGAGRLVYRNRDALFSETRSTVAQAIFGDDDSPGSTELLYADLDVEYDSETLCNVARVTAEGGTEQTASDAASIAQYLTHTRQMSGLLMQSDTAAANHAAFLVHQNKDPELRFSTMTVRPQRTPDVLCPQVLAREIGDRITIIRRPPGGGTAITRDVFIRGIEHERAGSTWVTKWALQSASRFSFLTLDHASLGVLDINALAY